MYGAPRRRLTGPRSFENSFRDAFASGALRVSSRTSMTDIAIDPLVRAGSPQVSFERTVTVIDASALVAFVLREEDWETIEGVLHENPTSVELLVVEAANAVLSARRRKRIEEAEAKQALRAVGDLSGVAVSLVRSSPLLADTWEIASEQDVTMYDAVYVALARRERTAIASRDKAQLRAARNVGVRCVEV